MLGRLAFSLVKGLGIGALAGLVGAALIGLFFFKAILNSFPPQDRDKVKRYLIIALVVALAAVAGLFFYLSRHGIRTSVILTQPTILLAFANLIIYALTIAPSLFPIRSDLAVHFPKYVAALDKAVIANFVSLSLSSGMLVSCLHLATDMFKEGSLALSSAFLIFSTLTGLVRLFTSVAGSYTDLALVAMYQDTEFQARTDLRYMNEMLQNLFTRPLTTWTVPIFVTALSVLLRIPLEGISAPSQLIDLLSENARRP